jgi:hypothetical protein
VDLSARRRDRQGEQIAGRCDARLNTPRSGAVRQLLRAIPRVDRLRAGRGAVQIDPARDVVEPVLTPAPALAGPSTARDVTSHPERPHGPTAGPVCIHPPRRPFKYRARSPARSARCRIVARIGGPASVLAVPARLPRCAPGTETGRVARGSVSRAPVRRGAHLRGPMFHSLTRTPQAQQIRIWCP